MNKERIAELREKSKPAVEHNNGLGLWNNGLKNDWYEQWFENFAELMVKECIKVVKADGDHWEEVSRNPGPGQEHLRDHFLVAAYRLKEDAVWSIEDHFGIKSE
jgi:hypothetical protein